MSHSVLHTEDIEPLEYIITHVFCPLQLPNGNDHSIHNEHALASAVANAAHLYRNHVGPQWHIISRMLENLQIIAQSERLDELEAISQFNSMDVGGFIVFLIRAQNAGVIFRKQKDFTIFESFELSPKAKDVMAAEGKLICSYPGPAIEIPNQMFDDSGFRSELVNFLAHMNHDVLSTPAAVKKKEELFDTKDAVHPCHITELLTGILRGVGRPAEVLRINKRVGDDVCNIDSKLPWRRSALWLLIRVALQTTLNQLPLEHITYKEFMLFFMCCLAREKTCAELPSHLLQFMAAKISRRLCKLGSSAPGWLSQTVLETCTSLRSTIEDRWKQVQAIPCQPSAWNHTQLDLARDIQLSLLGSCDYIRNSLSNHSISPIDPSFDPRHHPRGTLDDFFSSDGRFFRAAYRVDPRTTLYDVEREVAQGIDAWVDRVTNNTEACVKLETLSDEYSSSASDTYANNPELLSVMQLTLVELWVALDKIAVKEIPFLADYSPEVPTRLLENLLLCKADSLHRLRHAHEYLSRRYSQSRSQWSVFASWTTANTFAVRFYRSSSHLRQLKARIEEVARREVRAKVAELQSMNARYAELKKAPFVDRRTLTMTINVHVWPLPSDQLEAEAIVFELDCPISFGMWRTATFRLLLNICSPSDTPYSPRIELDKYKPLAAYFVKHPRSRISLGSDLRVSSRTPSLVVHRGSLDSNLKQSSSTRFLKHRRHRRLSFDSSEPSSRLKVSIPATRREVCIKNVLSFFAVDTRTGIPVSRVLGGSGSRGYCTYKLQRGPYDNLQKFVDSTSHTSNEVIANQVDCHRELSVPEYMAFGHLRSGGLLQWLNVLRELRARSLNFRRPEVHMLFAQAISQIGPLADTRWTWHQEIEEAPFCYALLRELEALLRDVEANWKEGVTIDTISFLLRRLLVSSPDQLVSLEALGLLRAVREKTFSWVQELSTELVKTPGKGELRGVLRDTAVVCRSTFDVDPVMIPKLIQSPGDVEVLLSCAIIIHDHIPVAVSQLSTYSRLLLDRDHRLSLLLESVISDIIQADSTDQGINLAVGRIWSDYHPGSKWSPLQIPNSRWFSCTTAPPSGLHPQVVHVNILDGSLLVNRRPLGTWLPSGIMRHPLYKRIFGNQMLQVMPSDLPGMDYCTKDLISNHLVHFSLRERGSDLVIRAKQGRLVSGDSAIIELIPHEKLEGDLPAVLIDGHAHWLNLSTSVMEIRPLNSLWKDSLENWRINFTPGHNRMQKGHECLVDIRSQTWAMVSSLLQPLCPPQDLIVSVSPEKSPAKLHLSVLLPSYDLSFFVDQDGDLQSYNMRGMVYDENQSIGTLFGLVNRLVLRPKIKDVNVPDLIPRCVIIPDGDISYQTDGHHVRVEITPHRSAQKRVTYQTYKVNIDLGCLMGNAGSTSNLYRAYLHALTSGYSIDPLTGRSGTEEALSILRSANCWSAIRVGLRDVELLRLIASICPLRTWHSKLTIQKVERRNNLPSSQSDELFFLSKAIKEHYERLQPFNENQSSISFPQFPSQVEHLLKRSARRAAYLFTFGSLVQPSEAKVDVRYPGRDVVEAASGEHRAYTAATDVYLRNANCIMDIWKIVDSWTTVSGTSTAHSLRYSNSWLPPKLPVIWLKTYDLLRKGDDSKWFQMLFSLPAMAYASSNFSELVPVFVAFASHSQFRFEDPPHYISYPFRSGCDLSKDFLRSEVVDSSFSFEASPESSVRKRLGERDYQLRQRRRRRFDDRVQSDADAAARGFLLAWPCETPPPCSLDPRLYSLARLESRIRPYFLEHFRNLKLKEHLTRVQAILKALQSAATPTPDTIPYSFQPPQSIPSVIPWRITVDQLFAGSAPLLQAHDQLPRYAAEVGNAPSLHDPAPLDHLIFTVGANTHFPFQREYVSALRTSAQSFGSEIPIGYHGATTFPTVETLVDHYTRCKARYIDAFYRLQKNLGPRSQSDEAVMQAGQWPCISYHTLFRLLASNSPTTLSGDWKTCLITFTLIALELQRTRRLLLLHFDNLHEEFWRELQNEGCDGWDAEAHPDWLLIQLQGNFLIRRVQVEVANEMMLPHSHDNTAMQLNMGEGKSSVIVPIVVVALANGNQFVRVIVPKPLTAQAFHLLTDRLGGLTNRPIYNLSFSRSPEVNNQRAFSLRLIMLECMRQRGILVVQPDHVLSLKLVSVEKQMSRAEKLPVAYLLVALQRWLHSHARDILDESDEILDVRSQLIFTVGLQQPVEHSPERWTTTQHVLSLVRKHASLLHELFPCGVDYEPGPSGSFPYLRILQIDPGENLISWLVQDVIDGLLPNLCFQHLHVRSDLKDAIRTFISCEDVSPMQLQLVKKRFGETSLWGSLLLLRGLLAKDILLFAFRERRWRVDYGLAPARTMLAVPYRAKDVPAQKAEFGHPDVAIILTCLSYYYAGLSEEQLRLSFRILFEQHDPSIYYGLWIRVCGCAMPDFLRTLSNVNIESVEQWDKFIYPLFSRNQATVDFYLSNVVFPREAKEFPSKLSSSGWDLAEKKERVLTGFSGTNDGQYLLPQHITQRDPDHQRGTNAKVLSYLLQPENNYKCMTPENGKRLNTREFLEVLVAQEPEIRVLLDVGAQMLDLQNHELAKAWLDLAPNASAAIYLNEFDELTVCTRDGTTQLLLSSPYAEQLERCVVYLDDAHTRGTDIKFPIEFRAAVTLGPKVTKDRLAQGCMRMRKLGHGHSIMFFAPSDVDRCIRSVACKDPLDDINTKDVLHWAIRETWENIRRWAPHWEQQRNDHTYRYTTWNSFRLGQLTSEELSDKWIQREAKTLEDLYEPRGPSSLQVVNNLESRSHCNDIKAPSPWSVGMDEEQERELVYEVRQERQVERASKVQPASHSIHQDVVDFIKTGFISAQTIYTATRNQACDAAFTPAFKTLDATSAAFTEAFIWGHSILVTADFARTVKISEKVDDYLRPVHWIVSAKRESGDVFVILSPYEVNDLLPDIRSSDKVHLHLYTPCVTKSMKLCDGLALHSIPTVPDGWLVPSSLMDQLNVFSGQLYLKDYETYIRLCHFLCLYAGDLQGTEGIVVEPDGFILPKNRHRAMCARPGTGHTFASTPLVAIKALMGLRSKGVDFTSTHMGRIVHGRLLSRDDFDG